MQKAKIQLGFRALAVAMAIALAGSTTALAAGDRPGWSFGFGGLGSKDLLEELTTKAAFDISQAKPVSVQGPDGPMPEIASQAIPMPAGAADPIPTLKKVCAEIGMGPPRADQLAVEPDTICNGMWNEKRMQVNAVLRCQEGPCLLYIETSAFGF